MTRIVYTCPFVPAEWIAAHGLQPCRIVPGVSSFGTIAMRAGLGQGVCPFAQSALVDLVDAEGAAAFIVTTTCDQMRRVSELLAQATEKPVFLFHVPTTWQTAGAQRYYREELHRLGAFLEAQGGSSPSSVRLAEIMLDYDRRRHDLLARRSSLSPRRFSEAIARFHRDGALEPVGEPRELSASLDGVSVALVGAPLLRPHFALFDLIESAGGRVVLDGTTTGERTMPPPFDRRAVRHDPLGLLSDVYFGAIPDAFRRPNSLLYEWLEKELAGRDVRGAVFIRQTWCDTWHGEAQRMKEWAPVPLLVLDMGLGEEIDGRTVSRIQSFLEVLS